MNPWLPDPQILALALQATVLAHAQVREAATAFASELGARPEPGWADHGAGG